MNIDLSNLERPEELLVDSCNEQYRINSQREATIGGTI